MHHPSDPSRVVESESLSASIHRRLLGSMDLTQARTLPREKLRAECTTQVENLLRAEGKPLSGEEKERLVTQILDECSA